MCIVYFIRKHPTFWDSIVEEMKVDPDDVLDAVSVFSALGFSTKMSISTIKTMKNIKALEDDYVRLRLIEPKFNKMCEKFPSLAEIDSFSPGLIAVMLQIASFLRKPKDLSPDSSHEKKQFEKLRKKAKEVNNFCLVFDSFNYYLLILNYKFSYDYFRVAVSSRKLRLRLKLVTEFAKLIVQNVKRF